MSRFIAISGLGGFALVLVVGLRALAAPGAMRGDAAAVVVSTGVAATHATDLVSAVVFDYRGLDTLGEEFILLAATVGVELLLRPLRGEKLRMHRAARKIAPLPSVATRWSARQFGTLAVVFGVALAVHGHVSPGGGFQGGAAIGAAALSVFLAAHLTALRSVIPDHHSAIAEGGGAVALVLLGAVGVLGGGAYLENLLPHGRAGTLVSAGTIAIGNLVVLVTVAGAFATVLKEFVEQAVGMGRGP